MPPPSAELPTVSGPAAFSWPLCWPALLLHQHKSSSAQGGDRARDSMGIQAQVPSLCFLEGLGPFASPNCVLGPQPSTSVCSAWPQMEGAELVGQPLIFPLAHQLHILSEVVTDLRAGTG